MNRKSNKTLASIALASILACISIPYTVNANEQKKITVNGSIVQFEHPIQIEQDVMLAQLRPVANAIGAQTAWDAETQTVVIIHGYTGVSMAIGGTAIHIRDMITGEISYSVLPIPPRIYGGTSFVPIEAVITALGVSYEWDVYSTMLGISVLIPVVLAPGFQNTMGVISARGLSSFVIQADSSLWSWGWNWHGQLGIGTYDAFWHEPLNIPLHSTPMRILGNVDALSDSSCDGWHTAAILNDGSLLGWGDNSLGQLGDGTTGQIFLGNNHEQAWSRVQTGEFGDNWSMASQPRYDSFGYNYWVDIINYRPNPIRIIDNVIAVSTGGIHTMAIKTDGSLWAWGGYRLGSEFGVMNYHRFPSHPVKVMADIITVSSGNSHTMAIQSNGYLWALGNNSLGQLGDNTIIGRISPVKIMDNIAAVSSGGAHTMAIRTDGSLYTWGLNGNGQLGDGEQTSWDPNPTPIRVMENVIAISAGYRHSMAIRSDGSLWAWGDNRYGQLGDGTTRWSVPNPTFVMDNVVAVSAGRNHTMAVKSDGSLWTWGNNSAGQLGDGTIIDRNLPVKIMDNVMLPNR